MKVARIKCILLSSGLSLLYMGIQEFYKNFMIARATSQRQDRHIRFVHLRERSRPFQLTQGAGNICNGPLKFEKHTPVLTV